MNYKERRDRKRLKTLESKIDFLMSTKFNDNYLPNTEKWIRERLSKDLRYKPHKWMMVKEDFIEQYNISRLNTDSIKYDFSLLPEYIKNPNEKVIVICLETTIDGEILGEFETNFKSLVINKKDISQLNFRKTLTKEYKEYNRLRIEQEGRKLYGNKYSYEEINYVNNYTKVKIYCNNCKKFFWKEPEYFLQTSKTSSPGCPNCSYKERERRLGRDNIWCKLKKELENKFGDRCDYSETVYVNSRTKIRFYCKVCKEYIEEKIGEHIKSPCGCPKCSKIIAGEKIRSNKENFIKKAEEIHGKIYDYSEVEYTTNDKKVKIYDPEREEYFWQTPNRHLSGEGNPNRSGSKGEKIIKNWIASNKVFSEKENNYEFQYKVIGKIEGRNTDIVIIDFKVWYNNHEYWIEYNGKAHYENIPFFHNNIDEFNKQLKRDQNVKKYCEENGIIFIEIPYTYRTYKSIAEVLNRIIFEGENPDDVIKRIYPKPIE